MQCLRRLPALITFSFLILFPTYILNAQSGSGFTEIKTLETVNSFAGQWCCSNGGYIYGTGVEYGLQSENYTTVLRKFENGQSYETRGSVTSLNPDFRIQYRIFSTSIPGLIFVPVKDGSGVFHLLKSRDGGATFTDVFTFGEGNGPSGTNAADVRLLRGILELTNPLPGGGGTGTLYIGEYNNSHDRIKGSENDRVRIMRSTDQGNTWSKVVEWNTNGANQVGHIHAMKQDPYTGEIYICTGDVNLKAAIIKWDGRSPWSDNKTPAEIKSMNGFEVLTGTQRYRVCDVLFDENYFYTFADTQTPNNPGGTESGIWRGRKNFSSYTRVDNQVYDYDPMHIGWYGEKIGSTLIFTTAREYVNADNAWKELNTRVYISNDGINWHSSGVINWRDRSDPARTEYITNVFTHNNKLYIDCVGGAGHFSTIKCDLIKKWKTSEDPVILHPVYFVGTWNTTGNDANSGTNPDAPKQTLKNTITSDNISAAARVKISAGNFNETSIYPLWSGAVIQGRGSVVIEGQGMDKTHIIRSSGSENSYGIYLEAARTLTDQNTPLILKDLDIYLTVDGGVNHSNYVLNNIDSYIKTIGCRIGNTANDDSPLINLNEEGAKYVSENSIHIANSANSIHKTIVRSNAANTAYHLKNSVILNAHNAFSSNYPGISFSLKNCTFYGIENAGVIFGSAWNTVPVIKNCIFSCGVVPIRAVSVLTRSDIDYNLYNRQNSNIADGGHSPAVGSDPSFIDASNGNFNLKSSSPCLMKGISLSDILYDFESRERKNPPSIGAFETPALIAAPSDVIIESKSGATGEVNVTSNSIWKASVDVPWLYLSSVSGNGSTTLTATATTPNILKEPRIANLTFSSTSLSPVKIIIRQLSDITTDTQGTRKPGLTVYPNPVSGIINIDYKNDIFKTVRILNSAGLIMTSEKTIYPVQQLDFSAYKNGFFILEFIAPGGEVKRIKIVNR